MEETTQSISYKLAKGLALATTGAVISAAVPVQSTAQDKENYAMLFQASHIASHNQTVGFGWYSPVSHSDLAGFTIDNTEEVVSYLSANNEIIPRLQQIRKGIDSFFPSHQVCIELYTDPEIYNYQRLLFNVQIDMEPELALDHLHRLWEEWAYSNVDDIWNKIFIDVEYV